MPPIPVPYTPRPFVGDRYEPHDRTPEYMRQSTRDEVEMMRRQGDRSAQMWSGIGQEISGTLRDIAAYPDVIRQRQMAAQKLQDEQDQAARARWEFDQKKKLVAQQESDTQTLNALIAKYGGRPPADEIARTFGALRGAQIDKGLDEIFGSPKDAAKRGEDVVKAIGGYGNLSNLSDRDVEDVLQSPYAGQVRYSFGPGMADGPEVMPNRAQQDEIQRQKGLQDFAAANHGVVNGKGDGIIFAPQQPKPTFKVEPAMVGGKRVFVQIKTDPTSGQTTVTDLAGRPVQADPIVPQSEAPKPAIPGDWNLEGNAFLKTIPPQWRKTVEKIARYDEDPTKVASLRGGNREQLMMWANQVNPQYDQSKFALRSPVRKAFTIGTQGQQINAINTAIGHIDQLTTVADQLQNGGFVPGNRAFNTIQTMFGSDKVTNFDTLKDALAGEVASVLSKSGATVSGIQDAQEKIHASNSPTQLAGYVRTLIPVMGSKLMSLDDQYKQAMGEDSFSALSDNSKQILMKHGFSLSHPPPNTPSAQDLAGLAKFKARKFTSGPFAGQTWTLDANGTPRRVQ